MKRIRILLVVSLVSIVAACGSDKGEGGAQSNSTIGFGPTATDADSDVTSPIVMRTQPFTITVFNRAGNPLKGVKVDIFQDVGSLFDANLVLQTAFPYQAVTDDFGNIRVYVQFSVGGGLAYKGSIQAFSGSAYNNAPITVTCSDSDTTTAPSC